MIDASNPKLLSAEALDPYAGVPMHVKIGCDERVGSFMVSPLIPLPPVIPGGAIESSDNRRVYVTVTIEDGVQYKPLQVKLDYRVGIYKGFPVQLFDRDHEAMPFMESDSKRTPGNDGDIITVGFVGSCDDFDEGGLVIAPVTYENIQHPSVTMKLKYSSVRESHVGYLQ
jgi:hypothetical protein